MVDLNENGIEDEEEADEYDVSRPDQCIENKSIDKPDPDYPTSKCFPKGSKDGVHDIDGKLPKVPDEVTNSTDCKLNPCQ